MMNTVTEVELSLFKHAALNDKKRYSTLSES